MGRLAPCLAARLADGTALLEARPRTGRTNQIRLQPWRIAFPHAVSGERVCYEAPVPAWAG